MYSIPDWGPGILCRMPTPCWPRVLGIPLVSARLFPPPPDIVCRWGHLPGLPRLNAGFACFACCPVINCTSFRNTGFSHAEPIQVKSNAFGIEKPFLYESPGSITRNRMHLIIDGVSLVIVPLLYLIFNLVFWNKYGTQTPMTSDLNWTPPIQACITSNHMAVFRKVTNIEECMTRCEQQGLCKSVGYNRKDGKCKLAQLTKSTAGLLYVEPCSTDSDTTYYSELIHRGMPTTTTIATATTTATTTTTPYYTNSNNIHVYYY